MIDFTGSGSSLVGIYLQGYLGRSACCKLLGKRGEKLSGIANAAHLFKIKTR